MQSKISLFRKALFTRFLIGHIIAGVLLSIGFIVTGPIAYKMDLNSALAELKVGNPETTADTFTLFAQRLGDHSGMEIIFILAALLALVNFYYLFDKRSSQMLHAMPFTRRELFVNSFTRGLIPLVLPVVTTTIAWLIVLKNNHGEVEAMIGEMLTFLVAGLLFYSMAVLLNMICGVLYLAPILYVIFNYLYVGLKMMVERILCAVVYGYSCDYYGVLIDGESPDIILSPRNFFRYTRTITMRYSTNEVGDGMYNLRFGAEYTFMWYMIPIVIFIVLAYVMYKKRPIENTGDFLVKQWLKVFFTIGITGCFGLVVMFFLFESQESYSTYTKYAVMNIFVMLAIEFVAYLLLSALFNKSFTVVKKKIILIPALITAAVIAIAAGCTEWDVAGLSNKIPEVKDIKTASASIFLECDLNGVNGAYGRNYENNRADIMDPEEVIKLHERMLDERSYVEETKSGATLRIRVAYLLKDGSKLNRDYYYPLKADDLRNKDSLVSKLDSKYNSLAKYYDEIFGGRTVILVTANPMMQGVDDSSYVNTYDIDVDAFMKALELDKDKVKMGHPCFYDSSDSPYFRDSDLYEMYIDISMKGPKLKRGIYGGYGYGLSAYNNSYYGDDGGLVENVNVEIYINTECTHIIEVLKEAGIDMDKVLRVMEEFNIQYSED